MFSIVADAMILLGISFHFPCPLSTNGIIRVTTTAGATPVKHIPKLKEIIGVKPSPK